MNADRDLLEHAVDLFPPPEPAFDRLVRRRDRKQRNQRIGVVVVALVLAAAAIGNAVVAFRSHVAPRPIDRGIDPSDVADLRLAWHGRAPHTGVGWVGGASAGDGVLLVATNDLLSAYGEGCATAGGRCAPMWTATGRFGPLLSPSQSSFQSATIGDGVAYVPGRDHLYAFDVSCRTDGGTCDPMWVSSMNGDFTSNVATLVGDRLYGSFYDPATRAPVAYAMPIDCSASSCNPTWVAHGWSFRGVSGDRVFATSYDRALAVFATDCRSDGGECPPLWTAPGEYAGKDDAHVYVFTHHGLSAYPTSCAGPSCGPTWVAPSASGVLVVGSGMVFASSSGGGRLLAFASDCGSRGVECSPSWIARDVTPRLVADGVVVSTRPSGVSAYPAHCRSDGGACAPTWISTIGTSSDGHRTVFVPSTAHNGVLFGHFREVGSGTKTNPSTFRAAAYALHCGTQGAACEPGWLSDEIHGWARVGPLVDRGQVYVDVGTFWWDRPRSPGGTPTLVYAFGLPSKGLGSPTSQGAVTRSAPDRSARGSGVVWPAIALTGVAALAVVYVTRRRRAPQTL